MQQGLEALNSRGLQSRGLHHFSSGSTETRFEERVTHYRREGDGEPEVETYERHGRRHEYGDPQHGGDEEYGTSYEGRVRRVEGGEHGGHGYDHVRYSSSSAVKSKEIPIGMLTQLLSERVGHRVEVGNIRTTLFDMFGKDASPTVKLFAKLALEQLQVLSLHNTITLSS